VDHPPRVSNPALYRTLLPVNSTTVVLILRRSG
jgi:hypothetical protein